MSFQTTYGSDGRLRVAILGCTGSIGTQALDVCRQHADRLQVTALSVNSSTSELVAAAREFSVPAVAVADVAHGDDAVLQELPEGTKLGVGAQAVCELARRDDVDCVLVAIVGAAGLEASHAALTSNKRLALANKESLVVGGDLLMPLAQPGQLIPVDSEHSAIYQCYLGENPREAHCIWLTCSGGPFFGRTRDELDRVTRADALAHPTWAMGAKITIDSATLMNKGLEIIEAMRLYRLPVEQVEAVIHRQSIVHSLVEYRDGAMIAQLGTADMKLPIQYALYYPERRNLSGRRLDLFEIADLTFEKPDTDTFRGLALAYQAMEKGGNIPTVYNAANEKAVSLFLDRKISYPEITELIEACMENAEFIDHPDVDEILGTEAAAYEFIEKAIRLSLNNEIHAIVTAPDRKSVV
mgnify:CR=1 FL=1